MASKQFDNATADTAALVALLPGTPNVDEIVKADVDKAEGEAALKARREEEIKHFREFGKVAGKAAGVATEMAFYFAKLCVEGVFTHADASTLYQPYAEAYNKARGAESEELVVGSNSYKAGLSTFATFGLQWTVALQRTLGYVYPHVKRLRDAMPEKTDAIGSLYQCYVAVNRAMHKAVETDTWPVVAAKLADDAERDDFIRAVIIKPEAATNDALVAFGKAIDAIAKLGKRAERDGMFAIVNDFLPIAQRLYADRDAMKAKLEATRAANEAALIVGSSLTAKSVN